MRHRRVTSNREQSLPKVSNAAIMAPGRTANCPSAIRASCANHKLRMRKIVEQTVRDHSSCAGLSFLGRLKDENHCPLWRRVRSGSCGPKRIAVWPSWPHACITPLILKHGQSRRFGSAVRPYLRAVHRRTTTATQHGNDAGPPIAWCVRKPN